MRRRLGVEQGQVEVELAEILKRVSGGSGVMIGELERSHLESNCIYFYILNYPKM